jgi:nicotinate-nucleotide pyrophosphorylase (carboxylating)
MNTFTAAETAACCRLIELALQEDFGGQQAWPGDVTSFTLIPSGFTGKAQLVVRAPGVVAGLPAVQLVLGAVSQQLHLENSNADASRVEAGQRLATIVGPINLMLAAERTALNFLQRLSGVATLTRRYVDALGGLPCQILDTRKTTPGWRLLEKYAVRCGGGHNHRMGLYDQFLIKDNHLAAGHETKLSISMALRKARENYPGTTPLPVEIEVDTLEQLDEALVAAPDIVLLDNMATEQMREAVRRRNERAPNMLLEASGGINLQTVRAIAETGVDRISVGALTHSAPALDIGLDYELSDG